MIMADKKSLLAHNCNDKNEKLDNLMKAVDPEGNPIVMLVKLK